MILIINVNAFYGVSNALLHFLRNTDEDNDDRFDLDKPVWLMNFSLGFSLLANSTFRKNFSHFAVGIDPPEYVFDCHSNEEIFR